MWCLGPETMKAFGTITLWGSSQPQYPSQSRLLLMALLLPSTSRLSRNSELVTTLLIKAVQQQQIVWLQRIVAAGRLAFDVPLRGRAGLRWLGAVHAAYSCHLPRGEHEGTCPLFITRE